MSATSLPDASCSEPWERLVEGEPGSTAPRNLVRAGGELFFDWIAPLTGDLQIEVWSPDRGENRRLEAGVPVEHLWSEGDRLLAWGRGRLLRLTPAPERLVTLLDVGTPRDTGVGSALLLPERIYWTALDEQSSVTLWRQHRESGDRERIASFGPSEPLQPELGWTGDSVLVFAAAGSALVLAPSGELRGALLPPSDAVRIGWGARGVYHSRVFNRTERGGQARRMEIVRSPLAEGEPVSAWRGGFGQFVDRVWEREGGLLGVGHYYRRDGDVNAVVVAIDERGRSREVACNPGPEQIQTRPVIWNDRLFAIGVDGSAWRLLATEVRGLSDF